MKCQRIKFVIPKQTMEKILPLIEEATNCNWNRSFIVQIRADGTAKGLCLNITEARRAKRFLTTIWKKAKDYVEPDPQE